jgi:hypothetical protein
VFVTRDVSDKHQSHIHRPLELRADSHRNVVTNVLAQAVVAKSYTLHTTLPTHILKLLPTGAIPPSPYINSPYTMNNLTLTPTAPHDVIPDSLKGQKVRSSLFLDVTRCILVVTDV